MVGAGIFMGSNLVKPASFLKFRGSAFWKLRGVRVKRTENYEIEQDSNSNGTRNLRRRLRPLDPTYMDFRGSGGEKTCYQASPFFRIKRNFDSKSMC